jgi:ketosteroid isomerase-like protein
MVSVEQQIMEKDREFERNVAAKDAVRLCQDLYAADARLLPPNSPAITGRSGITAFWKGLVEAGLADVTLNTTEIDEFGDLVYAVGSYRLSIRPEGAEGVQDKGKYVYIYKRQPGGGWKAIVDIFNSDLAAS